MKIKLKMNDATTENHQMTLGKATQLIISLTNMYVPQLVSSTNIIKQ